MRVASLGVARPAYYDRNATASTSSYSGNPAPAADVTRWSVTVASGKKILVESSYCSVTRTTAPTTGGLYYSTVFCSGIVINSISDTSTVVGTTQSRIVTGMITAYPGDVMYGLTSDLSTGGTVFFNVQYKGTQFDA